MFTSYQNKVQYVYFLSKYSTVCLLSIKIQYSMFTFYQNTVQYVYFLSKHSTVRLLPIKIE